MEIAVQGLPARQAAQGRHGSDSIGFLHQPARYLFFAVKGGAGKTSLSTAAALRMTESYRSAFWRRWARQPHRPESGEAALRQEHGGEITRPRRAGAGLVARRPALGSPCTEEVAVFHALLPHRQRRTHRLRRP